MSFTLGLFGLLVLVNPSSKLRPLGLPNQIDDNLNSDSDSDFMRFGFGHRNCIIELQFWSVFDWNRLSFDGFWPFLSKSQCKKLIKSIRYGEYSGIPLKIVKFNQILIFSDHFQTFLSKKEIFLIFFKLINWNLNLFGFSTTNSDLKKLIKKLNWSQFKLKFYSRLIQSLKLTL